MADNRKIRLDKNGRPFVTGMNKPIYLDQTYNPRTGKFTKKSKKEIQRLVNIGKQNMSNNGKGGRKGKTGNSGK